MSFLWTGHNHQVTWVLEILQTKFCVTKFTSSLAWPPGTCTINPGLTTQKEFSAKIHSFNCLYIARHGLDGYRCVTAITALYK